MSDWMERQRRWDFKIDPDNGFLVGPAGCHYEQNELPKSMYFDQLGLCGCGNPACVHAMLIECLESFDRDKNGWGSGTGIDRITEIVKSKPDVVAEFIGHFLDQKDLLEHGGSVYGSWLTERGKQVIEIGGDWGEYS